MSDCNFIRQRIGLYLDDELRDGELADFEAHVDACDGCRAAVALDREFLGEIRGAAPLYTAPEELRLRAAELTNGAPPAPAASRRFRGLMRNRMLETLPRSSMRRVLVTAAALLLIALSLWFVLQRRNVTPVGAPSQFALIAAETHIRRVEGQLPFEITSDSPEEISHWFAGKLTFPFKLPNYQESSGQERLYSLEGARLVSLNNDYAAYVGYRMGARAISLVVTSESVAQPIGGSEIASRGITFHYDSVDGLKVITWSDRGLTYALVSNLDERGQQSCVVCHQGSKDRDFVDSLKPTN